LVFEKRGEKRAKEWEKKETCSLGTPLLWRKTFGGTRFGILRILLPLPFYVLSLTIDVMSPISARKCGDSINFFGDPTLIFC